MNIWLKGCLTVAAASTIAAATATWSMMRHPNASAVVDQPFQKGRLWALLSDGNREAPGLIDSGATMSVLPQAWVQAGGKGGVEIVETPFGARRYSAFESESLTVGGTAFSRRRTLAADVNFPLIGADLLFSKGPVLFARSGLKFGHNYDDRQAITCARLIIDFSGNTTETPVRSIHFVLTIDGEEQKVFFDTGRMPALEGSASAPMPDRKPFPRLDVIKNLFGEWNLVPYFARKASVALGADEREFSYRHYFSDKSVKAPFVLGAGILETYSIVVDHQKGRACFFEA